MCVVNYGPQPTSSGDIQKINARVLGIFGSLDDLAGRQLSWTGDRTEFLGRNGTLGRPAALTSALSLSNQVGAGLDPCGVLQTRIEIAANGTAEIVFLLGETATEAEARSLLKKYRGADLGAVGSRSR
jgi:cyclic beta-1,2-glucan synthetase